MRLCGCCDVLREFMHPAKILTGFRTENLKIFVAFCMLQVKGLPMMPNVLWDVSLSKH